MGGGVRASQMNPFAGPARETAAFRTKRMFTICNYAVVGLSMTCMVTLLLIALSPSGWGWLLMLINTLTITAGIAGIFLKRNPGCYVLLVVMTTMSGLLQGTTSLALFTRTDSCLGNLNPQRINDYDGKTLLRFYAATSLLVFCLLWILLGLSCVIQNCLYLEFYEDLEEGNRRRGSAKVQNEFVSVQL